MPKIMPKSQGMSEPLSNVRRRTKKTRRQIPDFTQYVLLCSLIFPKKMTSAHFFCFSAPDFAVY
jgi:hypothetical protein